MSFFDCLSEETETARNAFLAIPLLQDGVAGNIDKPAYLAFLTQAYHHVRHTTSLFMLCGSCLPERLHHLRQSLIYYADEEIGHDEWILNDIRAAGGDPEAVRRARPLPETEIMVAYAYDGVRRVHPLGLFGMVLVLEGTSVSLATRAAVAIRERLGLPDSALTYLFSHGELDKSHLAHFRRTVDRITDPGDRQAVIHAATLFYRLYGDIFRALSVTRQAA